MEDNYYFQPETCVLGKHYYLMSKEPDSSTVFRKVIFIGYCPHPAEVLVKDGDKRKVIHRVYLFQKNNQEIEQFTTGNLTLDQYDFSSASESGLDDRLGA
jgi:hypothetical protein